MADWASLNGQRVVAGKLSIPWYGTWVADIELSVTTAIPAGTVALVVGDLMLLGTVYRQLNFSGARTARIVGGYAGWDNTIPARAYQAPGGVLKSTVLGDAAADAGEKIGAASLTSILGSMVGTAFVRQSAPAMRTLKQLTPVWWVDNTGATQILDRPALAASGLVSDTAHLGAIASQFNVISYSGGRGQFGVATETLSDWMPGRTFSSPVVTTVQTVSHVAHSFDSKGTHRMQILATP
jgi:hypothetical protein